MGPVLIAGVVVIALFLVLALFARGGATEPTRAGALPLESALARLPVAELGTAVARLFNELGFATLSRDDGPDRVDLRMEDPTPIKGQRIYVRCLRVGGSGAVESAEVQAALDIARSEQLAKAVVITPGAFSDEARLLVRDAGTDLLDGPALAALLRSRLPDLASQLGLRG